MNPGDALRIDAFPCDRAGAARLCAIAPSGQLAADDAARARPDLSLVARDATADLACASVWWRHAPSLAGRRVGVVGHYAARSAQAGAAVLVAAIDALRARGAKLVVGPMDGDTWHRYRLVTWRSSEPPFLHEPENPDDWPEHFEAAGFAPFAGYHSAVCDDLATVAADPAAPGRLRAEGIRLRPIDRGRLDADLHAIWQTACDAFADNLLYTPIAEDDFRMLYRDAIASTPPELTIIAERDGQAKGFMFAYPDALRAARREPVDTVVLKTLGVVTELKRKGLGRALFDATVATSRAAGFRRGILALMHDANPSARLARDTRRLVRRYALYAREP